MKYVNYLLMKFYSMLMDYYSRYTPIPRVGAFLLLSKDLECLELAFALASGSFSIKIKHQSFPSITEAAAFE